MKKILSIVLLVLATVVPADAQVVQPVYIRQAKITANVFDNKSVGSGSSTSTKIWSMENFESVRLTMTAVSSCNVSYAIWEVAGVGPFVRFRTAFATPDQDFWVESAPTSSGPWSASTNVVNNGLYAIASIGGSCTFDLDVAFIPITPLASSAGPNAADTTVQGNVYPVVAGAVSTNFAGIYTSYKPLLVDSNGALRVTEGGSTPGGPYTSISPTNVTTVATVATMTTSVRATLQNNGTGAALCLITTNASATVDANTYSFSLSAATAVNDGSGSTWTAPAIPNATTYIRCAALSGTARISGFTHP